MKGQGCMLCLAGLLQKVLGSLLAWLMPAAVGILVGPHGAMVCRVTLLPIWMPDCLCGLLPVILPADNWRALEAAASRSVGRVHGASDLVFCPALLARRARFDGGTAFSRL